METSAQPGPSRQVLLWASHSGKTTGGSERSLLASARRLIGHGYRLIVTLPTDQGLREPLMALGAEVLIVPHAWWVWQSRASVADARRSVGSIARFRRILSENGVDVVVSNTMTCPWAAFAARFNGIPHVWYVREFGAEDHGFRFFLGAAATYRAIDALSSSILVNSTAVSDQVRARISNAEKVSIAHPIIDVDQSVSLRARHEEARSRVRLIMVGMVSPTKGQLDAARAMVRVANEHGLDLELVLVGGIDRAYQDRIIKVLSGSGIPLDRVIFAGLQDDPITWMRESDIFVMASRSEAFGRVTVEAMACGLPVVGARSGGTPGLVLDGETGFLYSPGDIGELAGHIGRLAGDPGLRRRMGEAGRQRYLDELGPESSITSMIAAIENAPAPSGRDVASNVCRIVALAVSMHVVLLAKNARAMLRFLPRIWSSGRRRLVRALGHRRRAISARRSRRDPASLFDWSLQRRGRSVLDGSRPLSVIVPVYGDWDSLRHNIASVCADLGGSTACEVYYVNDCGPQADELEQRILAAIDGFANVHYSRNARNLGFVGNCNNAAMNLVDPASDVLLLNSDTIVTSGFAEEMQRVLLAEGHRIGAVTARSNAATIFSVPMDGQWSMEQSYEHYLDIVDDVPPWYDAPIAHGFCMMIRREVIDQFGLFDAAYGKGYGEENDFCMRIRRQDWRCAVANRSYVFHFRARSFSPSARNAQVAANEQILDSRYPEYRQLVRQYRARITEPGSRSRAA